MLYTKCTASIQEVPHLAPTVRPALAPARRSVLIIFLDVQSDFSRLQAVTESGGGSGGGCGQGRPPAVGQILPRSVPVYITPQTFLELQFSAFTTNISTSTPALCSEVLAAGAWFC